MIDETRKRVESEAAYLGRFAFIFLAVAGLSAIDYGTGSYDVPRWGVWHIAALAIVAWWIWASARKRVSPDAIDILSVLLVTYIAFSSLWSPDLPAGLLVLPKLFALFAVFHLCRRLDRTWLATTGAVAVTIALGVAIARTFGLNARDAGFGNINDGTIFVLAAFPIILGTAWTSEGWRRFLCTGLFIAGFVYLTYINTSRTEYIVIFLLVPALIGFVLLRKRKLMVLLVTSTCVVAFVGASTMWLYFQGDFSLITSKVLPRLELSINTLAMWFERPLFGHGIGSFETVYPRFRETHMTALPGFDYTALIDLYSLAEAAHNEFAQLLAETGMVGFILVLSLIGSILMQAAQRANLDAFDLVAIVVVIILLISSCLHFPMQKPATAVLAAAALGFSSSKSHREARSYPIRMASRGRLQPLGLFAIAMCFCVLWSAATLVYVRQAVASGIYAREFELQKQRNPAKAFAGIWHAYRWFPYDPRYRLQLFPALVGKIETSADVDVSEARADEVFAISMTSGRYQPALVLARARYLILTDRGSATEIFALLDKAKRNASALPVTHILEAQYAVTVGDIERARIALSRAERAARNIDKYFSGNRYFGPIGQLNTYIDRITPSTVQ